MNHPLNDKTYADALQAVLIRTANERDELKAQLSQAKQLREADNVALKKAEAKCAWQAGLLERARIYIQLCSDTHDTRNSDFNTAVKWLSDLEKGPTK